jgi:hypothetical protein
MVNADWVPTAITGATGILGACVGVLGSIVAGNRQMRSQQQLAMLQKSFAESDRRFQIYNEVLKIHAEYGLFDFDVPDINTQPYVEKMRPLLYEGLHLLGQPVREGLKAFEQLLWQFQSSGEADYQDVATAYHMLITRIEQAYERQSFRS